MNRSWVGAVVLGLVPCVAQAAEPAGWGEVAGLHRRLVEEAGIVGSGLVLVRDGTVAATSLVGRQDLEGRPVDADTIYHWASVTKTLTGIAIMQLRDEGRLSLDDPIVRYLPELRQVHGQAGDVERVTLRQLMSHTAGFRASTWPWGGSEPWHPFEPTRWEQLVAMLPYSQLEFRPGTKYAYSNPGVVFLGRVIELLSGDDYETYVAKNVFMPLGMSRSFFDRAPRHLRAHRSHSFVRDGNGLREAPFDFDSGITVSNGGLNAPLGDMARLLAFLAGQGPEILARRSLEEMWTPQMRAVEGEGASGDEAWAALSFFVEKHQGVELVGHSGDQNGFITHLYLHRPSGTAWVIALNTEARSDAGSRSRAVDHAVRDAILEHVVRPAGAR